MTVLTSFLRWWVRRPGPAWLLSIVLVIVARIALEVLGVDPAAGGSESVLRVTQVILLGPALAIWFLTTIQALRLLWHQSRGLAIALGLVSGAGAALAASNGVWHTPALVFALLASAAGLDRGLAEARRRQGALWLDTPAARPVVSEQGAGPQRAPAVAGTTWWTRNKSGCLGLLVLMASCGGWSLWRIAQPGVNAKASHDAIRPGMTLPAVLAAARGPFWSTARSEPPAVAEALRVDSRNGESYTLQIGDRPVAGAFTKQQLAEYAAAHDAELKVYRILHFTFMLPGVLARVSFTVTFDADGKVQKVSGLHNWD